MQSRTFDRAAALGGAGFTALAIASVAVVLAAPSIDASIGEVRIYLVDNHDRFGLTGAPS